MKRRTAVKPRPGHRFPRRKTRRGQLRAHLRLAGRRAGLLNALELRSKPRQRNSAFTAAQAQTE